MNKGIRKWAALPIFAFLGHCLHSIIPMGIKSFHASPFPVFSFHGHKEIKHRLNGGAECGEYLGAVKIRTVDSFPVFSFFSRSLYPCCFLFLLCSYLSPTASVLRFLTIYFCNTFYSVLLIP